MPTSTFYRLPEEKRDRLMKAVWKEFTRVPYTEASINRIILGAKIPRGSFYQYFLDTYKLVPDECLFIDDLQKNVEGARAAGMQAVQFCNNYQEIKANYL